MKMYLYLASVATLATFATPALAQTSSQDLAKAQRELAEAQAENREAKTDQQQAYLEQEGMDTGNAASGGKSKGMPAPNTAGKSAEALQAEAEKLRADTERRDIQTEEADRKMDQEDREMGY